MLGAARAQARATWFGVVVALLALVVSAVAWANQQQLSAQQTALNEYAIKREQRVYASRVAIWAMIGQESSSVLPPGLDVTIQNRSPVPLRDVRVVATVTRAADRPAEAAALTGELPPCTIARLRVAPPAGAEFVRLDRQWLGYPGLRLAFAETDRRWLLAGSRLALLGGTDPAGSADPALSLRVAGLRSAAVGDCSESS